MTKGAVLLELAYENRRIRANVASGKWLFRAWLQRTYLLLIVVLSYCCSFLSLFSLIVVFIFSLLLAI